MLHGRGAILERTTHVRVVYFENERRASTYQSPSTFLRILPDLDVHVRFLFTGTTVLALSDDNCEKAASRSHNEDVISLLGDLRLDIQLLEQESQMKRTASSLPQSPSKAFRTISSNDPHENHTFRSSLLHSSHATSQIMIAFPALPLSTVPFLTQLLLVTVSVSSDKTQKLVLFYSTIHRHF